MIVIDGKAKRSISYEELQKMNKYEIVNNTKNLPKSNFWYYTTFNTAEKIINNKYFLLNNITNMNDIDESNRIPDGKKVFVLCFCNSNKENIPMWYLYSGINGDGVSIGITPRNMIKLKNNLEIYECDDNNMINFNKRIEAKDYILHCGYVYYEDDNNIISYKNKKYYVEDFESENYFTKQYPWHYEKEFRIVIHIIKSKFKSKKIGLFLNNDYIREFRIRYAPEMNIKLKYDFTNEPEESKLNIKMNLLEKNKKSIEEHIMDKYLKGKIDIVIVNSMMSELDDLFNKKQNRNSSLINQ